jgi:hypothetical protein
MFDLERDENAVLRVAREREQEKRFELDGAGAPGRVRAVLDTQVQVREMTQRADNVWGMAKLI